MIRLEVLAIFIKYQQLVGVALFKSSKFILMLQTSLLQEKTVSFVCAKSSRRWQLENLSKDIRSEWARTWRAVVLVSNTWKCVFMPLCYCQMVFVQKFLFSLVLVVVDSAQHINKQYKFSMSLSFWAALKRKKELNRQMNK